MLPHTKSVLEIQFIFPDCHLDCLVLCCPLLVTDVTEAGRASACRWEVVKVGSCDGPPEAGQSQISSLLVLLTL